MSGTMTLESVRGGVRPFVEWVEQARQPSPAEAEELLTNAAIPVFLLEQLWESAREMMDRGVEHGRLVKVVGELLNLTDHCIRAFTDVRAQIKTIEINQADVSSLEAATKKLREMWTSASGLLKWLNTPPPPIDMSKLPQRSGERVVAGYIGLDEMAARLRADKPR